MWLDREIVRGPRWFRQATVAYASFDEPAPLVLSFGPADLLEGTTRPTTVPRRGLFGAAADAVRSAIVLKSPRLSPSKPWTLSFWWALPNDLPIDGSFDLFSLTGKGFIGAFTRGKGDWCALQRPAGVLQVYYFAGIPNVNEIYDSDLAAHVDLRVAVWHHCAAVFRMGTIVELFTDGQRVARVSATGRPFRDSDAMTTLSIGRGILLDELAVLDAVPSESALRDYVRGMRRIAEYSQRIDGP